MNFPEMVRDEFRKAFAFLSDEKTFLSDEKTKTGIIEFVNPTAGYCSYENGEFDENVLKQLDGDRRTRYDISVGLRLFGYPWGIKRQTLLRRVENSLRRLKAASRIRLTKDRKWVRMSDEGWRNRYSFLSAPRVLHDGRLDFITGRP